MEIRKFFAVTWQLIFYVIISNPAQYYISLVFFRKARFDIILYFMNIIVVDFVIINLKRRVLSLFPYK